MSLISTLLGSMTSQSSVQSLSGKTGLSGKQISALLALALPILLKAMTSNASSGQGASSLLGALSQHTNPNKKTTAQQIDEADTADGKKIINHILGNDTDKVVNQLAGQTNLSADQVSSVLSQMAPAMMSGVNDATNQAKKGSGKGKADGFDLSDGFDMKDVKGILGAVSSGKGGGDLIGMLLNASKE